MKSSGQLGCKKVQKNVRFDTEQPSPKQLKLMRPELDNEESEDSADEREEDNLPEIRIEDSAGVNYKGIYQRQIGVLRQKLRKLKANSNASRKRANTKINNMKGILKQSENNNDLFSARHIKASGNVKSADAIPKIKYSEERDNILLLKKEVKNNFSLEKEQSKKDREDDFKESFIEDNLLMKEIDQQLKLLEDTIPKFSKTIEEDPLQSTQKNSFEQSKENTLNLLHTKLLPKNKKRIKVNK